MIAMPTTTTQIPEQEALLKEAQELEQQLADVKRRAEEAAKPKKNKKTVEQIDFDYEFLSINKKLNEVLDKLDTILPVQHYQSNAEQVKPVHSSSASSVLDDDYSEEEPRGQQPFRHGFEEPKQNWFRQNIKLIVGIGVVLIVIIVIILIMG